MITAFAFRALICRRKPARPTSVPTVMPTARRFGRPRRSPVGFPIARDAVAISRRHSPAARKHSGGAHQNLLAIAGDDDLPGIVRATALDLIGRRDEASVRSRVGTLVRDEDPLVRAAAIGVLDGASYPDTVQQILPALEDQYMAVRIAAARALRVASTSGARRCGPRPISRDPHGDRRDGPGPARSACRRTRVSRAIRQDPQLVDAWTMVIRIRAAVGRPRRRLRRDH